MLLELGIKNFAIIDDLRIEFDDGLNVITGETGSGKSIIIDALGVVLGARANKDLIKKDSEKAFIEASFYTNINELNSFLEEIGIETSEILTISKEINLNKPSISRINGQVVTITNLNKVTELLIDIFAQHESQAMMNVNNQKILIDSFGNAEHKENLKKILILNEEYSKLKKDFDKKKEEIIDKDREIDLLRYQIEEIENANLTKDDEEKLENDLNKNQNASHILENINAIIQSLKSDYSFDSIIDLIDKDITLLVNSSKYDTEIESFLSELEEIRYTLNDFSSRLESYSQNIYVDEENLEYLTQRLDTVNNLKRKYGNTIEEIEAHFNEINERMEFLLNYEDRLKSMEKDLAEIRKKMEILGEEISLVRREVSTELESKVASELIDLNIKNAKFKVEIKEKDLGNDGKDKIEFLISTNIGEALKPLAKTASGGEMSRIMLGFKSIIAKKDKIETLIFDEIDTGISGKTAQIVGNKIKEISKDRQVIVISHLPQIVALSNSHYVIEKEEVDNRTHSSIKKLTGEERVRELARLISGLETTETAIQTAREMIDKNS